MGTQVTLTIPDNLYLRVQELAEKQDQNIQTILVNELTKSIVADESDFKSSSLLQDETVEREKRAYQTMHHRLWSQYPGQHVAIHAGRLVDHDEDGIALSRRIYAQYPEEFVLIKQVESQPERTLRFRSPRFVKEKA